MRCDLCTKSVARSIYAQGKHVCPVCAKESVVKCEGCTINMLKDDAIQIDDTYRCWPCAIQFLGVERQELKRTIKELQNEPVGK